jgi:hypothetical protein
MKVDIAIALQTVRQHAMSQYPHCGPYVDSVALADSSLAFVFLGASSAFNSASVTAQQKGKLTQWDRVPGDNCTNHERPHQFFGQQKHA